MANEPENHQPETPPKTPTESAGSSDSWLSTLPAEAQEHIKELRRENASRRNELKDVRQQLEQLTSAQQQAETTKLAEQQKWQELAEKYKTDYEAMQQQMSAERLNNLKLNIAAQFKLPPELASRLQGADEDTLRADAESLAKLIPGGSAATDVQNPARSRQTTSAVPDGQPTKETDAQRRERLYGRRNSGLFGAHTVTFNTKTEPN